LPLSERTVAPAALSAAREGTAGAVSKVIAATAINNRFMGLLCLVIVE
jgi:hypothetical protein